MRIFGRFGLTLLVAFLLPASTAAASQISGGSTVTYTAAPGETNSLLVNVSEYDTSCGGLAAPCLSLFDSGARITAASGGCVIESSNPIAGDTAVCPVPSSVSVSLGDHDDSYWGWNGPDVVDAGTGNDNPIFGGAGDDVLHGGVGSDVLIGQYGDDTLDGGPGDDDLDGVPGGHEDETATTGSDTYIGGGGGDSVTYEERSENLSLSPDGVADDGAAGEHDNIGADISLIMAGHGSDTMTGNAGRNLFSGGPGDDVLTGAGGDDQLNGGYGNDRLVGGDGQDVLGGDDGDDRLEGGAGVDRYYGDDVTACLAYACPSGQDLIEARDGAREQIECGPGTDTVNRDNVDVIYDSVQLSDECESVDPPVGPGSSPAPGPAFKLAAARVDRRGRLAVRVDVPGPGMVSVRAAAGHVRVGRASRRVSASGEVRLTLAPSRAARRALARRHRLKVAVRVGFRPASGLRPADRLRTVWLRR
jgi:hypothetical protein